jgi:hypothetical protein
MAENSNPAEFNDVQHRLTKLLGLSNECNRSCVKTVTMSNTFLGVPLQTMHPGDVERYNTCMEQCIDKSINKLNE